jgi:hypothetical protein
MAEPTIANTGDRLLDALANYLQASNLAEVGKTLFVHRMPFEVNRGCVFINNFDGSLVDPYIPNYRRCRFRLVARESSHPAAFALINPLVSALTLRQVQLDDIEIKQLIPENDPVVYPFSLGSSLLEISVVFNAVFAITE